ncbi:hypothetical protein ASF48_07005 [Rathayibacter sp. Leaf299]|uniref:hypothetical protein n=1 Tax=Rathayibacter sp. Leaf299 TaxID=1736328 RepID=UPI0006FD222F|nr:hypothetical protein [Rathayibacter sp. Leaf299]KQQ22879.1 hypothetical protein ASF48_07005 [Rathayibacter sp. Leaf299]
MTIAKIEAGTLKANAEARVVSGLLLPFGEVGTTNLGKFSIAKGAITIPEDVEVLNANVQHDSESPVGRFLSAVETDSGIVASFSVGKNPEGDTLLAEIADGSRSKLSAEVKNIVLRAGVAVSGVLFGAAFVTEGAFPSAALMAADVGGEPVTTEEKFSDEYTDADGKTFLRQGTRKTVIDGDKTTITEVIELTEPKPDDAPENEETDVSATVPSTLQAGAPKPAEKIDANSLFAAVIAAKDSTDPSLLAALADIKYDSAGAPGLTVAQPAFVGELWAGRGFQRKVIPLLSSGTLTGLKFTGWRWNVKPEVGVWTGNKSELPTNTPTVTPYTGTAQRFAGAWDIAREYTDFNTPENAEFIASLTRAMVDSYAIKSDAYALAQILSSATTAVLGTGVPATVNPGIAKLVRGSLRVIAADATPSFALVAPDVYEQILWTPEQAGLKFLSQAMGLEEGQIESFKVVPHTGLAAGQALVGAKEAATALELGTTPIRVSAVDLAKGGYDEAVHGYIGVKIDLPGALQLVTNNA